MRNANLHTGKGPTELMDRSKKRLKNYDNKIIHISHKNLQGNENLETGSGKTATKPDTEIFHD